MKKDLDALLYERARAWHGPKAGEIVTKLIAAGVDQYENIVAAWGWAALVLGEARGKDDGMTYMRGVLARQKANGHSEKPLRPQLVMDSETLARYDELRNMGQYKAADELRRSCQR